MGWYEDIQSWGAGVLGGAEGAVSDAVSGAIDQGASAIQAVQGAAGSISGDVTNSISTVQQTVQDVSNYVITAAAPSPQVQEVLSDGSVTQVAQYQPDIVVTTETQTPAAAGTDIFQQVVTSAGNVAAAVGGAVTAADTFLAGSVAVSAAGSTTLSGPATEITMTTPVKTTTTTTTSPVTTTVAASPTPVQTAENVAVLLGAGILSAPASIFDILSNAGSTEVNAPANILKLAQLGVYAVTGEGKEDVLNLTPSTSPESTYGKDIREAVVGAISEATGTKMTTTPLTTFMLPSDITALKSENTVVRGTAVLNMTLTGLGDWILGNPVTAFVGPLQILDITGKVGTTGYVEKTTTGVGSLSSLVTTGISTKTSTKTTTPTSTKQVVTKYKVTAVSNKPACWGQLIGTSGCP